MSVLSAEIERVFGGGGSQATVEVVFEELLTSLQQQRFERLVEEGSGVPDSLGVAPTRIPPLTSPTQSGTTERDNDITMTVSVTVESPQTDSGTRSATLFTGKLTKIEENHERVVTLHGLDRRFDFNRNSVFLDTDEKPAKARELMNTVLQDMGLSQGQDYEFDYDKTSTRISGQTWGVESHTTVYEFLQDMVHAEKITMHIDRQNKVWFTEYPDYTKWGNSAGEHNPLPPIIEWTNSNEENQTETIAESTYDETGLGIYTPINQERLEEVREGRDPYISVEDVNTEYTENNVIAREAVKRSVDSWLLSDNLMRDSGTIRVIGDPGFEAYDEIALNDSTNNAFSPISQGQYISKTCRHIINNREGYIVELELGDNPDELFRAFSKANGTQPGQRQTDEGDYDFDELAIARFQEEQDLDFGFGIGPGAP